MSETIRVSIGGGKGGVGKSIVATNLAVALARAGLRTVLVDADLGTPNLHTMLGVDRVGPTLQALLDRRIARLDEAAVGTGVPRLSLVAGTTLPGAANLSYQEKLKLIRQVRGLDAEAIVIDVGAGSAFNTIDLFAAGDLRLVVATPELTSIQNAYCFVRAAVVREIEACAKDAGALEAWRTAHDRSATARLGASIRALGATHPEVARLLEARLHRFDARWVGNRIEGADGAHAIHALGRLARDFLSVDAAVACVVPASQGVARAIAERRPLLANDGADRAFARAFDTLVEAVVTHERRVEEVVPTVQPWSSEPDEPVSAFASRLGPHRRRAERFPVSLPARLSVRGGQHDATLVDVSREGVRVCCRAHAALGDRVQIRLGDRVVLDGEVRHAESGSLGILLDPPSACRVPELLALAMPRRCSA